MTENGSVPHTPATQATLRDLWGSIRRSRWLVLGITVIVVALVGVFTALATPIYESEATLRIATKESGKGMLGELPQFAGLALPGMGQEEIDTEMGVLRSRHIAEAVVDSVGLVVDVLEPNRSRGSVLNVLRAGRDAPEGEYTLELRSGGGYTVQVENQREPVTLPPAVSVGQPFEIGAMVLALSPVLNRNPPDEIRFVVQPFRNAVQNLRDNLLVERQEGRSKLLEISFRHRDPQLAAAVVNAVAASFLEYKRETSKTESRSMVEFLREQTASYGRQLAESEGRLRGFRERQQVVSPGEEAIQQVRQAAALRAEREATQIERESLAQLLAQATQGTRPATSGSPYRQLATFPSFITNPAVQAILGRLTSLEDERSALLLRFTPENDQVQRVGQRVQELEIQLYRLAVDYLRSLDNKIAAADAALARSGRELAEVPARENEFGRLARDQGLLNETYMLLQRRLKEAEIQNATDPGDVRVVDPGLVPEKPVSPRPAVNLVLGTMLGLMLGLAAALGREIMDTTVRSRSDATAATGGIPLVGTIPRIRISPTGANGNGRKRKAMAKSSEALLVTQREPRHPASEAFRALRTNISFAQDGDAPQVLVVTSASLGDGKSTSAANLAVTLAQQGNRTLLADADLRQGLLHRTLGGPQEPGLSHLLLGGASLDEAVRQIKVGEAVAPLHFLPSGSFPPNPAELLGSERMRRLLEEMRSRYDTVIFDAPPLNLVTDAAVLGRVADATLLVVRTGSTNKDALQEATAQLSRLRVPVGGMILNDFDAERSTYAGSKKRNRPPT